jgi:hypothetical protein
MRVIVNFRKFVAIYKKITMIRPHYSNITILHNNVILRLDIII